MADKNALLVQIATLFADNANGDISPSDLRIGLSAMVSADLNLDELTTQEILGAINFTGGITKNNLELVTADMLTAYLQDAPVDDGIYSRRNGEWVQNAVLLATSNATFTVSGSAVTPSFLPVDTELRLVGIEVVSEAEGSFRNVTGRTIGTMTGSVSFNPDKSNSTASQLIIISETSSDGVTWVGNLNSIRNVSVSGDTESFNTKLSFAVDWQDQHQLRFRAYETGGGTIDMIPASATILGQAFTGPSLAWELSEK